MGANCSEFKEAFSLFDKGELGTSCACISADHLLLRLSHSNSNIRMTPVGDTRLT